MKLPSLKKETLLHPKLEVTVSNRTILRIMLVVVLTLATLALINKVSNALILIFVAFFLALALNAPVHWIAQHLPGKGRGSRTLATSLSFLIVITALVGFLAILIPPAVSQTGNFIDNVPGLVRDSSSENSSLGRFIRNNHLQDDINNFSKDLSSVLKSSSGKALTTVSTVGTSLVSIFTVLALTFMMLVEGPYWIDLSRRLLPEDKRGHATRLTRDMYRVVRSYVNGQLSLAAIAAVLILPVLLILNVPYAGALAPIVFICALIPLFGHIIAATIVTLVALFESPVTAVIVLSYYILYQQIENYVIQPRIQANATNMSPLIVFAAVLIGINLNGLLGGLVAIPVAGCIRILLLDYLQARGKLEPQDTEEAEAFTGDAR